MTRIRSAHELQARASSRERVWPDDARAGAVFERIAGATPPPAVIAMQERTGMTWAARQAMVGRLYQAGVALVSGVDAGISGGKPHGILALAVADLVAGGVPAAEAIASATSLAADACGLSGRKGWLRPGHDADLIIVDGDPLTDIRALSRIQAAYLNGQAVTDPAA